jgi:hypothetical protein
MQTYNSVYCDHYGRAEDQHQDLKGLRLTVPPSLLVRADEVIE